ncbi:hypothetical protein TrRE_jg10009 [Triparma retinervis]|uniref:phosphoglucomutase (alpha-D-glucose-1,6-bisphosphate-dependent) n=1 Tax=Triparma retinervis TaxID=2557542 RepID=A0A9W7A9T0_9STRA|nr:hypothetical protein TrRE_jg10009 [Triparma retinervis]
MNNELNEFLGSTLTTMLTFPTDVERRRLFTCKKKPMIPTSSFTFLLLLITLLAPPAFSLSVPSTSRYSRPTTAYLDQRPGTSGLRKKTKVWTEDAMFMNNLIQSYLNVLSSRSSPSSKPLSILLASDGRYHSVPSIAQISKVCGANSDIVSTLHVPRNGVQSTPSCSSYIRSPKNDCSAAIILTASHNPGGPEADFGVKFNGCNVVIVDPYEEYVEALEKFFDFKLLKDYASKGNRILFDGMHGAGGPFGKKILGDILGFKEDCFMRCDPREDFGGCHPDPNLTYGKELVERMGLDGKGRKTGKGENFQLGAANDGDGDRNLICGKGVFVTPSDSLAVIADRWEDISSNGALKGVARSMPSSAAVDIVAKKKGVRNFVTPTGWKFFGNLMDSEELGGESFNPFLCGEESFGTGSSHIREKDGLWAVLAWASILAKSPSLTVEDVVNQHWEKYGRHYYARYDYEECGSDGANDMMEHLRGMVGETLSEGGGDYVLKKVESFSYTDPVTEEVTANQGMILSFLVKGSPARAVFRLSGTGSAGATVRMYLEKYDGEYFGGNSQEELKGLGEKAIEIANLEGFTGRKEPTVIT